MSMRKKFPGSVVRANPVVPTEDSASGIWTLEQQNQNQSRGKWPFTGDPNFKDTVLLLHGDTSQQPSIEDKSAFNHEVTVAGDAKATNWSPFNLPEGHWSYYFESNHPIEIADSNSALDLPGDFTIEFWVFEPTIATGAVTTNMYFSNQTLNRFQLQNTGSAVNLYINGSSILNGTTTSLSQWKHIALVREGSGTNNISIYINGSREAQGTSTYSIATTSLMLGGQDRGGTTGHVGFIGYISNFRISKGVALYSGTSFTVPTAPLTVDINTSLLTCQSNRIFDNSTNNLAFTTDSSSPTKISTFSPFSYTSTATENNYGSYYFDGSGDTLTTSSSTDFVLGTSDFTIEFWFYRSYPTTNNQITVQYGGVYGPYFAYSGTLFYATTANGSWNLFSATNLNLKLNAWNHIAFCRNGSTISIFSNGTRIATTTSSAAIYQQTNVIGFGNANSKGYISNFRTVIGSYIYDATQTTYTVPTKPTELTLVEGENSVYMDGSGDYLLIPSNTVFDIGTSDFSIEFAFYSTASLAAKYFISQSNLAGNSYPFIIRTDNSAVLQLMITNGVSTQSVGTGTTALQAERWYWVQVIRTGSTEVKLYLNGTEELTTTLLNSTIVSSTEAIQIGRARFSSSPINGYTSNVRFRVGNKSSVTTFPTSPLASEPGTVLLACASRYIEDKSSANHDIAANGDAVVSGFNPFNDGYWSNGFLASGERLSMAASSDFQFGTGDFTVELWVKYTAASGDKAMIDFRPTNGSYSDAFGFTITGSALKIYDNGNKGLGGTVSINTWTHLVLQRVSGVLYAHVNGTATGTTVAYTTNLANASTQCTIGSTTGSNTARFNGHISNVRIVKGSAIYGTGNFTVSTAPFTTTSQGATASEVKLLTCQSSRFIDNSSTGRSITVSGTTSIKEDIPFTLLSRQTKFLNLQNKQDVNNKSFQDSSSVRDLITITNNVTQGTFTPFSAEEGKWSVYLDGAGDYLTIPDNAALEVGSNNFTFEVWYMPLNITSSNLTICDFGSQGASNQASILPFYQNGSSLVYYISSNGTAWTIASNVSYGGTLVYGEWHHLALVRNGSTITPYFNGVAGTSVTTTSAVHNSAVNKYIGAFTLGSGVPTGYISNFRLVNGTAVYTSAFTPPTKPLTAIANTSLLLFSSNTFVDKSTNNFSPTVYGTPRVLPYSPFAPSRSYSKEVVGGNAYFDGSAAFLKIENKTTFDIPTNGPFSMEVWLYVTTTNPSWGIFIYADPNDDHFQFSHTASGTFDLRYAGGSAIGTPFTVPTNSWQHLVVTRDSSGWIRQFLNGVLKNYNQKTNAVVRNFVTFGSRNGGNNYYGYMSNLRWVNGSIPTEYQTTETTGGVLVFTPPTAPVTKTSDTLVLLNFTDSALIDNTGKNNLEPIADAKVSSYVRKFGNGSMYFDGTDDYIKLPYSENFNFGTASFTWEAWVHPTDISGVDGLYGTSGGAGSQPKFAVHLNAGTPSVHYNGVGSSNSYTTATSAISANTWTYLAYVRNGTTWTWYINGVASGTGSETGANLTFTTQSTFVGYGGEAYFTPFNGYIEDMRVTKGVARYTSNFTPPVRAFKNR